MKLQHRTQALLFLGKVGHRSAEGRTPEQLPVCTWRRSCCCIAPCARLKRGELSQNSRTNPQTSFQLQFRSDGNSKSGGNHRLGPHCVAAFDESFFCGLPLAESFFCDLPLALDSVGKALRAHACGASYTRRA